MKRIMLTSLEFGTSFGVDRAICDLIIAGRLSAVGCSVTGSLWTKEFYQLRDVVEWAEHETKVGLTVCLTGDAMPVTDFGREIFGEKFPNQNYYRLRAPLNLLPDELIAAEVAAQIDMFENVYARAPAFIAVQGNMARFPVIANTVIAIATMMRGREPAVVAPLASRRYLSGFVNKAVGSGLSVIHSGPSMPMQVEEDDLRDFFWHGLNEAEDQMMVFCHPAYKEEVVESKKEKRFWEARQNQLNFLNGEEFPFLLMEKDIFLF
ncbi:ChbG/HpnK family deacetylase [Rhodobacteraceae bacterium RKSG542]|uniref:ChbG/HpnK family deacetylase n=1 Tax=Pseudovibrio flavus TaxID=2529854 RepID=UPI0012BB875D|nr:ChbG/HpnK family deacetylase [Pseudovibrio flavus]MTI18589.1 ChbG/HpnK family deacetylase [Pseudovibrio flavus]